jgi:hypothetical protein
MCAIGNRPSGSTSGDEDAPWPVSGYSIRQGPTIVGTKDRSSGPEILYRRRICEIQKVGLVLSSKLAIEQQKS